MRHTSMFLAAAMLGCTPQEVVARDDAATTLPDVTSTITDAVSRDMTPSVDTPDVVVAAPDAVVDTPDTAPVSDVVDASGAAVWPAHGESLTLRVRAGLPAPTLPGDTCTFNDHTYTYLASTGALRHVGCVGHHLVDRAVTLDASGRAALEVELAALRTTTDLGCGADYHELTLTVSDGGATHAFNSTYFAGCPGSTLAPPYIAGIALDRLDALLSYTILTCADGDAGMHCTTADGGVPDGG